MARANQSLDFKILNDRVDVERQFLHQARVYPIYAVSVAGWLHPTTFSLPKYGAFWAALLAGVHPGMTDADAEAVVSQAIIKHGLTSDDFVSPLGVGIEGLAREVARRAWIYNAARALPEIARAAARLDDSAIRQQLAALTNAVGVGGDSIGEIAHAADTLIELLGRNDLALKTGLPRLDRALGGLPRGELTLLGGRPGMGKTALGWQIAEQVARSGHKVAFFSLEMAAHVLLARRASAISGVLWRDIVAGAVNADEIAAFRAAAERLKAELTNLHIFDGRYTSGQIWEQTAALGAELVVVDHVRHVADRGDNENLRQGTISATMKEMAKALKIPVLVLVQLNRSLRDRQDKRPRLTDLRDSGELEQNADNVLMLYRDDYYSDDPAPDVVPAEILVRKFRNGPRMVIHALYDRPRFWFRADFDDAGALR